MTKGNGSSKGKRDGNVVQLRPDQPIDPAIFNRQPPMDGKAYADTLRKMTGKERSQELREERKRRVAIARNYLE